MTEKAKVRLLFTLLVGGTLYSTAYIYCFNHSHIAPNYQVLLRSERKLAVYYTESKLVDTTVYYVFYPLYRIDQILGSRSQHLRDFAPASLEDPARKTESHDRQE